MSDLLKIQPQHATVLLIDDSSIDNFVNKKIIERYHFAENVLTFTRASKALEYLIANKDNMAEHTPLLLFLDLNMPEMDGYEFMEALNLLSERIQKNAKVVILTSSINPQDQTYCCRYPQVITFLHKPLVKNNLEALELILETNYQKLKVS